MGLSSVCKEILFTLSVHAQRGLVCWPHSCVSVCVSVSLSTCYRASEGIAQFDAKKTRTALFSVLSSWMAHRIIIYNAYSSSAEGLHFSALTISTLPYT